MSYLLLLCATLIAMYGIILGIKQSSTVFNPLTYKFASEFLVFTVLSAVFSLLSKDANTLRGLRYENDDFQLTMAISLLYYISYLFGYTCLKLPSLLAFSSKLLDNFDLADRRTKATAILTAFIALASGLSLIFLTSGGYLWISDPRTAYIQYRMGNGHFYALYIWMLSLSQIYLLYSTRNINTRSMLSLTIPYIFMLYFTGSKGAMITPILISTVYHDSFKSRVKLLSAALVALILVMLALALLAQQVDGLSGIFFYFSEYFSFTSEYIHRSSDIPSMWGHATMSTIYSSIPRAFLPEKPVIYGYLYIHDLITPGAPEEGNTFGILPWTLSHLDFGLIGVMITGIATGTFNKLFFNLWWIRKTALRFIIFMSVALVNPFPFTTPATLLLIVLIIIITTKSKLGTRYNDQF